MKKAQKQFPVDTAIASAGTGKTYNLVEKVVDAVVSGIAPDRILATTFTKKAAAELAGRVRAKLIDMERPDLAAAMLSARIGTVNSVCGSLIADFAFTLGRSPATEVITEDRQASIFSRAAGPVIEECGPNISAVAERFGIPARSYTIPRGTVRGWHDDVRRIIDLARSNGISAERLVHSADQSVRSLLQLLPTEARYGDGAILDNALSAKLVQCEQDVDAVRETLKKGTTDKDVPLVEAMVRKLKNGERIGWPDWARLTKLGVTKADGHLFEDVISAASLHPSHPALAQDIETYIRSMFDCAAQAMETYAAYKNTRGLLDFVDQEMLALKIITSDANFERLEEMIGAVFVDEYQDSSPIQIAIFTALSRIAPRNFWVGDPKQSIYGFRDADPELTSAAAAAMTEKSGGNTTYLRRSYRTRPTLAEVINEAVTPNFLRAGMSIEEVQFDSCERLEQPDAPPALSCWDIAGKNKDVRTGLLAARITGLLAEPELWPVFPKVGLARAARGGDIAILCRGNAQVSDLAMALSSHGLRVAVEREGLLSQPEIELALAAFRWVADPTDTLALAEMARLMADDDKWLSRSFEPEARDALLALLPDAASLEDIRARASQLTPAEIFDAVLYSGFIIPTVIGWGNGEQRLHNLEAMRSEIAAYQDEQHAERQAVTLTGACEWVSNRKTAVQPQSRHPDAINILTYHGAKGLEWPIVVMTELDAKAKGSPFGLVALDEGEPDWNAPLSKRILRFWPWPYGEQKKDVGLDATAAECEEGKAAMLRERLERTRLMYVGLTRARDHLALTATGSPQEWMDELTDDDGAPVITIATDELSAGTQKFALRSEPEAIAPNSALPLLDAAFSAPSADQTVFGSLRLNPSNSVQGQNSFRVVEKLSLGDRIPLVGNPDMQLVGEAIHRFLAADDVSNDGAERRSLAKRILKRWNVPQLDAEHMVSIADRFHGFVEDRFVGGTIFKELPIHADFGNQVVVGRLDLLIEINGSYCVIDHKSFPGNIEADPDRLSIFGEQVALYGKGLQHLRENCKVEYWAHQPIAGIMSRVELTAENAA
jgi:ATP-dependent helicase/nuclease subunit A